MAQITAKEIKDAMFCRADTVGKNKAGNFMIRRGFFYRNGMDSQKFATAVMEALGDRVKLVDCGEVWKPFRGGATTANSSHFWAEVSPL